MSYVVEQLPENKAKITVTIPAEEVTEACHVAAEHMAEDVTIPGYRPGKAPYEAIKQKIGEMAILEHATEDLVRQTFVAAMVEADLDVVGQPFFAMEKLAPDNDFIYTAEIALMPQITKLADWTKLSVEKKETEPTKELLEQAKADIVRMQTKEVKAEAGRALTMGDKAIVNLTMKKDGVVLEGGESKNHGVFTNESYYVPGFVDEILGLKEGEEKTFTLNFPAEHYQKHLAGQPVDFTIKLNEIFLLQPPMFDDAFAVTVGLTSASEMEEKLMENLRAENKIEEARRLDKAVLDLVADKSTFDIIPDLLVNQEIEKMTHELEHQVTSQGMDFTQYLASINKSLTDLKIDFTPAALQRIKVGIILKKISAEEKVTVDQTVLDAELDKVAEQYKDDAEAAKQIYEPQYRDYIERQMVNRKTIDLLKEKMVR